MSTRKIFKPAVSFLLLCLLTCGIVFNPFYLRQQVNLFELGLYLPGIDAILHGQIPFKDFFLLRGPFELYLPAFLMKIFGTNVAVLSTYFYIGTVLTLIACLAIGAALLRSNMFLWIMALPLIARTYPRVVFTYWGGMRYVWGLLAVLCAIYFLKSKQRRWIIASGLVCAIAGLTSPEIGLSAFGAIAIVLMCKERLSLGYFCAAVASIVIPFLLYLQSQGALTAYFDIMNNVVGTMTKTFVQDQPVPSNLPQVIAALVTPHNKNFHHMTPVYCYLCFGGYLIWRARQKRIDNVDVAAAIVMLYSLFIYVTGFRNIWANVFEMALQPEKIILFFMLERLYFALKESGKTKWAYGLLTAVIASSLIFSVSHINKRFVSLSLLTHSKKGLKKIVPLANEDVTVVNLPRIHGMTIPQWQEKDFHTLVDFVNTHVSPNEPVLTYPEGGALSFIIDRPAVSRFPTATMAWIKDQWLEEWMDAVQKTNPKVVILNTVMPPYFQTVYFLVEQNKVKYQRQMAYIHDNYKVVETTPTYQILMRKY